MEPFHIDVPDEVLNDLKTRLKLTRGADDFANECWQYGTNTTYLEELVAYWIDRYDWRQHERAMNTLLCCGRLNRPRMAPGTE